MKIREVNKDYKDLYLKAFNAINEQSKLTIKYIDLIYVVMSDIDLPEDIRKFMADKLKDIK